MELEQLRALVALADAGSFAGAARSSGLSRTTLRRRLSSLGEALGCEVVVSDGRDVAVTPVGDLVVIRAREILARAQALDDEVRAATTDVSGTLCVLIPMSVHPVATAIVARTARLRFPDLTFDARYVEDPIGRLDTEGDIAMHWGPLVEAGARIARRVRSVPLRLLASRSYVEERGVPESLDALAEHDLLTLDAHGLVGDALPLLDGDTWPVRPMARSNNVLVSGTLARMGGGIALAPAVHLPGDGWPEEDVVKVLPEVVGHDLPNWIVGREVLSQRKSLQALIEEIGAIMDAIGA